MEGGTEVSCKCATCLANPAAVPPPPDMGLLVDRQLQVKLLDPNARSPRRATSGSVGYDLFAIEDRLIKPGCTERVRLGISIKMPPGVYGRIADRSSKAGSGLFVTGGVIDPDYRGELVVILNNNTLRDFDIEPGQRIAQLILECYAAPDVVVVQSLGDATGRGSGGFGSTGVM